MKLLKLLIIPALGVTLTLSCCQTKNIKVDIKTDLDSMSYALGVYNATGMKQNDIKDINFLALAKGLEDVYSEKENVMTMEEAVNYLNNYFTKKREQQANDNLKLGQKFLEDNAKKEGVVVDPSGVQFKVLQEGSGPRPLPTDVVKVHYHGTRIDGTVFDSSVERGQPAQFPLDRVIKGWTIGVGLMNVGSKYILYIPSELAYGANPRPGVIEPNDVLIFEVELLEINPVDSDK